MESWRITYSNILAYSNWNLNVDSYIFILLIKKYLYFYPAFILEKNILIFIHLFQTLSVINVVIVAYI